MTQNEGRPSRVVGRQVKRLRKRQGISAQRLADRCTELGALGFNRSVIANIESRREDVGVDELMILAAALNTPPTLLLAPLGDNQKVAVTPKTIIHPHLLLDWMTGGGPLCNTNQTARLHPWRDEETPDWREASLPIWMFQQFRKYQEAADEASRGQVAAAFDKALGALSQHVEVMERSGLTVPAMPADWQLRMAELSEKDKEED